LEIIMTAHSKMTKAQLIEGIEDLQSRLDRTLVAYKELQALKTPQQAKPATQQAKPKAESRIGKPAGKPFMKGGQMVQKIWVRDDVAQVAIRPVA
jgi:hypothetical protein